MTSRVNLCANPSIEVSTAGFTAVGSAALSQSSTWAQVGTKSLAVVDGVAPPVYTAAYIPVGFSFTITTTIGDTVTVSAYVNNLDSAPITIIAAGVTGSQTTNPDGGVERISVTFTAAATTTTVTLQSIGRVLTLTHPFTQYWENTSALVDAILAEKSPVAGTYFDGGFAGCTWSGTTGLSTSTYTSPPATIDATADPTTSPPRVTLFANNVSGTSAQVTRLDPDGQVRPVRLGDPAVLVSGQWVGIDYEMPYNAAVTYTVTPTDLSTPQSSTAVTVVCTQAWLIHPGIPSLSQRVNRISLTEDQTASGATLHWPLGRATPVVVTDGTRKSKQFTMTCRTTSTTDATNMQGVIQDTTPLLLQIVYPFTGESIWRYISIDSCAIARVSQQFGDTQRTWTFTCTEVDRPAGGIAALRTWGDLVSECATWNAVLAKYATWTGVVTGIVGT